MARGNFPLYSLNQGEVSKLALARVDLAKLRLAAECQVNWQPYVIGPMTLRTGLQYIGEVLGDQACRILPFIFSKLDTALLEFTPGEMRIWVNEAQVTRSAVATTISDPNFAGGGTWVTSDTTAGASATIGSGVATLFTVALKSLARIKQTVTVAVGDRSTEHGIRIVVTHGPITFRAGTADGLDDLIATTDLDTGTHSLACTPHGNIYIQLELAYAPAPNAILASVTIDNPSSGSPTALTIPTPFGAGDLANIRTDQSGDVIYVACYGMRQRKIERRSTTSWSVVDYLSNDGPFDTNAVQIVSLTPSIYANNGTLTADRAYFQTGDVGQLIRLFSIGQFYATQLGGANAFTPAVRVVGVGTASRNYTWTITNTWVGTLTFQRSFDGPDSGFVDISTATSNGTIGSTTGGSGGTPDLDNAIAWERVGFKAGNYSSGVANLVSNYGGGGAFAIVRITSYNSATSVNIEVLQPFSSLIATSNFSVGQWTTGFFPTCVGFHEGRLGFSGGNRVWLSASDDYTSFAEITQAGQPVGDAGPINFAFGFGPVDDVSWLLSLSRLLAGREQSIASIRSSSFDTPLTPTNLSVKDCSTQGAMRLPAVKIDKRGIYVQQSNRRVYDLSFVAQEADYTATDLTRLNLDIGKVGFVDVAVARQPDTQVHLVRSDGMSAELLYDPADDVVAWTRLMTLGVIENVAVLPTNGIEDLVYFVVKRTINGVTRRFIERLALRDNCIGGAVTQLADSHYVYQGSAVSTVTLSWLPSTEVVVWADGSYIGTATTNSSGVCTMPDGLTHTKIVVGLGGKTFIGSVSDASVNGRLPDQVFSGNNPSATLTIGTAYNGYPCEVFADIGATGHPIHIGALTVASGVITLPNGQTASSIVACLGYVAPFMSAKLGYAAQMGTAVTQKKKIDHVGLVMYDTNYQGVQYGQRFDALDALPLVEENATTAASTVWSAYDEPMVEVPGEWNSDVRLCLLAQAPKPCTIGAVVIGMTTHEK